jgi:hypothetical protein
MVAVFAMFARLQRRVALAFDRMRSQTLGASLLRDRMISDIERHSINGEPSLVSRWRARPHAPDEEED